LDPDHWPRLDAWERGYTRVAVQVVTRRGEALAAQTYVSELLAPDPALAPAYKRFIVDGAREHGLPDAWLALLEELPER
jgi:hypothetical protein